MDLSGAHVAITGGSRGIGAEMAAQFVKQGATLSLAARSADGLAKVAADIGGAATFPVDLTDADAVAKLVPAIEAEAGPIDVLINNAGIETSQWFHTTEIDHLQTISRLNFEAPMVLTRQVLDGMIERDRGHLVFVSSVAGTGGFPGLAPYCGTKAGITNFAATVRMELRDTNIGVTVIAPGPVDTEMWDHLEESRQMDDVMKRLKKLQLIPKSSTAKIAKLTVNAVAKNRDYIGLPKRLASNHMMRNMPSKVTAGLMKGVPMGPTSE